MVSAVDLYGDLMRCAISAPGNDFRLGGMEAPPAVISTYLGQDLTDYLTKFMNGTVEPYEPKTTDINLGVDYLPVVTAPAEDRNRTSPFPYGGHRFEFRAVGSTQNVSLVNTCLASMVAAQFKFIADKVEAGESAVSVAQELLQKHMKAVFNGNGYAAEWPEKAKELGLAVYPSGVDAICQLRADKNKEMFNTIGVFTPEECNARVECLLGQYTQIVEVEAMCMKDMIQKEIVPILPQAGLDAKKGELLGCASKLEASVKEMHGMDDSAAAAAFARTLRLEVMDECRKAVDAVEKECPESIWPIASYKDCWFIDQTTE